MTRRFFVETPTRSESRREDVGLHPPLSARREAVRQRVAALGLDATALGKSLHTPAGALEVTGGGAPVRPFRSVEGRQRNVVVTVRRVSTPQTARRTLLKHVAYIRRGATEIDGEAGSFFDGANDNADPRDLVERCQGEGHHYRIMINPEDGAQIGDIRAYGRRVMEGLERDLGARLQWVAGAHFDTGRPHLHVLVRGRRADGLSLAAPGTNLWAGVRERAQGVATEMLGPRAERNSNRTNAKESFTSLDRILLRTTKNGRLDADRIPEPLRPSALCRLNHLATRGWVTPAEPGTWEIPSNLRQTLQKVAQRYAQERAATRVLASGPHHDQRSRLEAISPEPGDRLVGAYVGVQRAGRYAQGPHAVVLDLTDGRLANVLVRDAKAAMCLDRIQEGAVVEVAASPRNIRAADRTVAAIATGHGGVWSPAHHQRARPGDSPKYIAFHQRRVETMSLDGACVALGEGRFAIPDDYCDVAHQADVAQWGKAELNLRVLDHRSVADQVGAVGITWLDRLMNASGPPVLDGPFGEAVNRALSERAQRLRMTGLGSGDPLILGDDDIHRLTTLEIKSVFESLGRDGKPVFLTPSGQQAAGTYTGRIHVAGAPYAILEDRSTINLIPWQPGLEACRRQNLIAVVQDGGVNFRSARALQRDLGLG